MAIPVFASIVVVHESATPFGTVAVKALHAIILVPVVIEGESDNGNAKLQEDAVDICLPVRIRVSNILARHPTAIAAPGDIAPLPVQQTTVNGNRGARWQYPNVGKIHRRTSEEVGAISDVAVSRLGRS